MNSNEYDYIVLGGGFSGLSCGLRLGMFEKKVAILEKHSVLGGLNSYYVRKNVRIDTGLHALTNYTLKGDKSNKLLPQILKQFRLSHDEFKLRPQSYSRIILGGYDLRFSNDLAVFQGEVQKNFPAELENFLGLVEYVKTAKLNHSINFVSAREEIAQRIHDPELLRIIFYPILCYGSCWEEDIDLDLFISLFRAIFLEGFARPRGGITTLLECFTQRIAQYDNLEIMTRTPALSLAAHADHCLVQIEGKELKAKKVFSSLGHPETLKLMGQSYDASALSGISFVEVVLVFEKKLTQGHEETMLFFNEDPKALFRFPITTVDLDLGVICSLENYQGSDDSEAIVKISFCGNYAAWLALSTEDYKKEKLRVIEAAKGLFHKYRPQDDRQPVFVDCFTPKTIHRYTSHLQGAVYGSQQKFKNGLFGPETIVLLGADQGNIGITGAILSGADMANRHGLKT